MIRESHDLGMQGSAAFPVKGEGVFWRNPTDGKLDFQGDRIREGFTRGRTVFHGLPPQRCRHQAAR